jgi:hypothetical protein
VVKHVCSEYTLAKLARRIFLRLDILVALGSRQAQSYGRSIVRAVLCVLALINARSSLTG